MIKSIEIENKIITYNKIVLNNTWNFYIANLSLENNINKQILEFKNKLLSSNIPDNLINNTLPNAWLQNSNLIFKLLFCNIYGLYIGGSRALKINKETSDYDIIFILANTETKLISELSKYLIPIFYLENASTEVHAHFYFHTYDKIFKYISYFNYWVVENYLNRNNNLSNCLIFNSSKIITFFTTTSKKYFDESLNKIKIKIYPLLSKIKDNNLIWLSERLEKSITHLVIINCQLQNKQIDKDKIIKLKEYARLNCNRLLVDPPIQFEPEVMQYLKDNLIELNDYFENRFNE